MTESIASPVERLAALFAGNEKSRGTHGEPDPETPEHKYPIKGTAKTLRGPATVAMWEVHIAGTKPLGVVPIRQDGSCSWGSIDYDVYDVNLLEVVERVEKSKLPLVPCVSKSGGLHLFLFLKAPEPAGDVQAALRRAAASLGMAGCEIFPKQTHLADDKAMGNWMVMPYFGGDFGGKLRMQHGIKKTGAEMTLGEFVTFAEGRRTTLAEFGGIGGGLATASPTSSGDFADGPPCLERLTADGPMTEGRKRTLFMMACYFRRCDETGWKERLEAANQKFFNPPLPSEEVAGVKKSVGKKDYQYTCKVEPMLGACNSIECKKRKFGVGDGDGAGNFPVFEHLEIRQGDDGDETTWIVTMLGGKTIRLTSDEVYEQKVFNKRCLSRFGRCFHLMRPNAWSDFISRAAENVTPIMEAEVLGEFGQFHELLEEFLTNRAKGNRIEDVLSGRPFEDTDEKRHWFTLRALMKYLQQESPRFRHRSRTKIGALIRDRRIGGDNQSKKVDKKTRRLFWVPSSCVEALPEIEPPPIASGDEL